MSTDTLIKVQDADRINDTRKAELLSTPIEHIDITQFDARPIIDSMGKMSFTSRDLARATGIYNQMLEDPACSIILVVAGSTSAGGCARRPTYRCCFSPPVATTATSCADWASEPMTTSSSPQRLQRSSLA